ncbi:Xaa-Pro dipeptidase [Ferrimonas aestuarii]|nr:amidohydrolase family protein [Ferrimonas aestuarii]
MRRAKTILATALLGMVAMPTVWAQTLLIKADALVDVEQGRLVESPQVLLEGNQIIAVGRDIKVPPGAKELNLEGHTLLPGLFDMHVHITGDSNKFGYRRLTVTVPGAAITGVANAKKTLDAGFTSIRNLGAPGFADVALKEAINAGEVPGPRLFVSGPALGITGGHCDNNFLPYEYQVKSEGVADGPWKLREKVRRNLKYGADLIKFCATGGVMSKGTKVGAQQFAQEEMNAIVAEAKLAGVTVAAHAHGTDGIKAAIRAGVDTIEHASFLDDEAIALAKEYGTTLSMDIYNTEHILSEGKKAGMLEENLAKERSVGGRQRESFRRAVEAGVNVVFGSDAAIYPHGQNGRQFSRMVKFGMSEMQALQAATIKAATVLKQQQQLGSIEVGKLADIIAVKGNPLEDISLMERVSVVIKDGQIHKAPD